MSRSGADLALLFLSGYRMMVDTATVELAGLGYPDFRPVHEFALRAIAAGAESASDLGRRTSVSKQAAAKTIEALLERGYITREPDARDARRKRLQVTDRGREVMAAGEEILDDVRRRWMAEIGATELGDLESRMSALVGDARIRPEAPGDLP